MLQTDRSPMSTHCTESSSDPSRCLNKGGARGGILYHCVVQPTLLPSHIVPCTCSIPRGANRSLVLMFAPTVYLMHSFENEKLTYLCLHSDP
jgi:hypothetical protein